MEQKHADAIRKMVTDYCHAEGLVPKRGVLHVRVDVLNTSHKVKVVDTEGLDLVFDRILREAFEGWIADPKPKTASANTIVRMRKIFEANGFIDRPIGCLCRHKKEKMMTHKDVGLKMIWAIEELLDWIDRRLTLGCCTDPQYDIRK